MVQKQLYESSSDKSHLLFSCNEPSTLMIDGSSIETNTKEVLLWITIYKDLKFDDHVNSLCKNDCQKLNALSHLQHTWMLKKECIHMINAIMKAFIESQFKYCLLVRVFHSWGINKK